jgi:hypothetical protein
MRITCAGDENLSGGAPIVFRAIRNTFLQQLQQARRSEQSTGKVRQCISRRSIDFA